MSKGTYAAPDHLTIVFDGQAPDSLACDTTLRELPDGSWATVMLGGGHTELLPQNRVFQTRSMDSGRTWSPMAPVDLGVKKQHPSTALVPSELMVYMGRFTSTAATRACAAADIVRGTAATMVARPSSRAVTISACLSHTAPPPWSAIWATLSACSSATQRRTAPPRATTITQDVGI